MRKHWDDVNWLPTFRKHTHNLKFLELKILKIKNLLNIILRFQDSFATCQWGVMYMTSKAKFYFMIQEKKS
jgi:hypothetical protein